MSDLNALRLARRARCVDGVGKALRQRPGSQIARARARYLIPLPIDRDDRTIVGGSWLRRLC